MTTPDYSKVTAVDILEAEKRVYAAGARREIDAAYQQGLWRGFWIGVAVMSPSLGITVAVAVQALGRR